MPYMTAKRIALEVALIKMCKPQMQDGYDALERRMDEMEQTLSDTRNNAQIVYVQEKSETQYGDVSETGENLVHTAGDSQAAQHMDAGASKEQSDRIVNNLRSRYKEADYREIMTIVSVWNQVKKNAMKITRNFLNQASVTPGDAPGTIDLVIVKNSENALAIDYFEKKNNIDALEETIAEMTERTVHIGLRKLSPREADDARLQDWDLSKINFDNIEYKY